MKYPSSLEKLIKSFEVFPGVGPNTSERLALFLATKMSKEQALGFSNAIKELLASLTFCHNCASLCEGSLCDICLDQSREQTLMIVENTKDVISFEKTGIYHGKYHVLGGLISPLLGVSPDDINLKALLKRCHDEGIKEVILSLSSTVAGEVTSLYINKMFENTGILVYRIGYGLPVGAEVEYADEITLKKALEGKRKI